MLADDMRNHPSLHFGIPERTLVRMIHIIDEVENNCDRLWGITTGPRWSWDNERVGGHVSATYDRSGETYRETWMIARSGDVLRHEFR